MTKPKITDEMVERAGKFIVKRGLRYLDSTPTDMRGLLEAALTEPEEIPVSEGMMRAGLREFPTPNANGYIPFYEVHVAECYRAMEATRREEQGATRAGLGPLYKPGPEFHRRDSDGPTGLGAIWRRHRRKGDPK